MRFFGTRLIWVILICLPFRFYAQEQFPKVMAQEGDGIYSLLRRHGVSPTKHYNSFVEMNAEDLGEDETLIMGRTYILPDTLSVEEVERVEGITYPIFGQEFKRVDKASDRLANTVYYLISGLPVV